MEVSESATKKTLSALQSLSPKQLACLSPAKRSELAARLEQANRNNVNELCGRNESSDLCGPLYWGQRWTATENPKWEIQGLSFKAPFPRKAYFLPLFAAFFRERRLFIPKTREMLTSWCAMLYATHQAQWHKKEVIVQTQAEQKAYKLIDYVRQLYQNQPDWLREKHPLKVDTLSEKAWESGGRVLAIPKGENQIRLYHPTIYIMDEAAFLSEAQQCYDAASPVASQIIGISSAGPGWFGDECSL